MVGQLKGAEHQDFLDRLFLPDVPRETVEEFDFWFQSRAFGWTSTPDYFDVGFPNVTRVFLNLGGFSREELVATVEVMSRKGFLEELSLEAPSGIPEEAFGNLEEPGRVLLRMTNLKKLSLLSGDRMGQMGEVEALGNRSMYLFARLSLTHLSIIGDSWERVTENGILALTEGPLGESVVSLELDGLKGRDVWGRSRSRALLVLKGVARGNRWTLNSA